MKDLNEQKILNSWNSNVLPWIDAVRNGEIESRILSTNTAILRVIHDQSPKTVLDIGCGEGWLCRELNQLNIRTLGVDVVPEFIKSAQRKSSGDFKELSFDDIVSGSLKERYDSIVCNFSLLGHESVSQLLAYIPELLNLGGSFIVQTIHPISGCGEGQYKDGWRKGSWSGFNPQFHDPAPWYFRTLESWKDLFDESGFDLKEIIEPLNPKTKIPASVIFIGRTE